jgi:hypothetical protein
MALYRFSNLNKYGNWRHRIVSWPDNKPFSHGPGFGRAVGVQRFKYEYEHAYIPPALLVSPKDGQKYIIPSWTKVHSDTQLSDIKWIKPEIKVVEPKETPTLNEEFKFESKSDPGSFYVVRVIGDRVKCNCAGQYRAKDRQCKHMKEVMQKLGIVK